MRPLALTAAIIVSFAGSAARAESLTNPSGITLGDLHDPGIGLVMRAPLWMTAEGYMVARDATFSTDAFNDVEPLRCWDLSVDPPVPVGAPLDRPAGPLGVNERAYRGHLAVAPDGTAWTVATGSPFELHVYTAACDADPTLVRALTAADVAVALQGELWDDAAPPGRPAPRGSSMCPAAWACSCASTRPRPRPARPSLSWPTATPGTTR